MPPCSLLLPQKIIPKILPATFCLKVMNRIIILHGDNRLHLRDLGLPLLAYMLAVDSTFFSDR